MMIRKTGLVLAAALLLAALPGCGKNEPVDSSGEPVRTESPEAAGEKTEEIGIYTMDETTLELADAKASVTYEGALTPETVVDAVVDAFAEHGTEIGIDHIEMPDEDTVVVGFTGEDAGKAPLCTVGSGVEAVILDAVSQSLLDNIPDCRQVIFRIEDKAYESGVFVFGYDQAYKWR